MPRTPSQQRDASSGQTERDSWAMKILPFGAVAAVLALSSCASVSVKNIERHAQAAQPPAVIYLQDYDTRGGNWKITSRSRTPEQFKGEAAELLSKNLAADLEGFLHVP